MTYRLKALANARAYLGVTEHPPNSNSGPEVTGWLNRAGVRVPAPWCMAFQWCMFDDAGLRLDYPNLASVGFFEEWARDNGYLVDKPEPGDLVCYRFDADNWPDHVGIVETAGPSRIVTIEGNTSVGNDANGGTVMRRSRAVRGCRFVRIPGEQPVSWPRPLPAWWWLWNEWRLGEGGFAAFGPKKGPRPARAPRLIPLWAWARAIAFDRQRRKS